MVFSSIISCPLIYLFSPNCWILITHSTDLHRSIPVFKRILCKAEEISLFCNGKKQGVNQTSGPSCQGTAVLCARVQKYETAEIGQAVRKKGPVLHRKGGGNRRGSPKDLPLPHAFPATPLPFLQHKPGPWLCSAEQFVVSPGAVRRN